MGMGQFEVRVNEVAYNPVFRELTISTVADHFR